MKTASKILFTTILVLAIVLTAVACNPDEDSVDTRPETVATLVDSILTIQNSGWKSGLTDEEILALDRPADYIVAREWASFAGDIVLKSGLQEAKIQAINNYVLSDKGRAFLKGDGSRDINHFIASFKAIGLTSTDLEGLVYDGVYSFVKVGKGVVESILSNLESIKGNTALSAVARQNVEETTAKMKSAKASFEYATIDAENTLQQLDECKTSIKNLVSFSYDTAMLFGNGVDGDLIDAITSGTLAGASVSEIATYLGSVIGSVKEMSTTIETDAGRIQTALNSVFEFYTIVSVDVPAIDTIMMVLDNYKTLPTVLPLVCDFVENVERIALGDEEHSFINNVMDCFRDGYRESGDGANVLIAYARIALASLGIDYTASTSDIAEAQKGAKNMIVDAMNQIVVYGNMGRGKMPIIYLAFLLNGENESGEIYGVPVKRFADLVLADNYFKQFKRHFREYRSGVVTKPDALISSANFLLKYCADDGTVSVNTNFSEQWYNNLCDMVLDKINSEMTALYEPSYYEMDNLANTLSTTVIYKLLDVASLQPQKVGTAGYDTLTTNVENLYAQIVEAILA